MQIFSGHTKRVNDIAFSPDSAFLVSSANDGTVRVWDTRSGEGNILIQSPGRAEPVAFTPDGQHVLLRPGNLVLEVWNVADKRRVRTLIGGTNASYGGGLAVSVKSGLVVANEWVTEPFANVLYLWDATTWQEKWKEKILYQTHDNYNFAGLAFDSSGSRLVTTVGVFDLRSGTHRLKVRFPGDAREWSTANVIASAGYGPTVHIQDADTGMSVTTLLPGPKHVQDFAFSSDGCHLAVVSNEETVRIWDTRTWEERPTLAWGVGKLKCIAFSPDGTRVACGSHNGTILVWDWDG